MALLRSFTNAIVHAVFPPSCAACDDALENGPSIFCEACSPGVEAAPPHLVSLAPFLYGGALAEAIVRLKFRGRHDLGAPLGRLLVSAWRPNMATAPRVVAPVPIHPDRLEQRGYNQATLLAREVASAFGASFRPTLLARTRSTAPQVDLARAARLSQLDGAFCVTRSIRDVSVLVVDDVRTTGATLGGCQQALREAGANAVQTVALAQTESDTWLGDPT